MQQRITFRQACLVTLFSGLLLSGGSTYAKEWKSITIATEGGYEPWNLTLPGGETQRFRARAYGEFMPADEDRMQTGGAELGWHDCRT